MASPKKILIAGAGLGGLAAAIRLARAGCEVEVWEKNEEPGGKLRELRRDGFAWGTGPSLLTMPHVLEELFADAGAALPDHLELVRLESGCRYFWTDGTVIDEDDRFWQRPEVADFLRYAGGIYELAGEAFLHHPPSDLWRSFAPAHWPKLRHLPKVATTRTLAREVERRLRDPHVRQIFLRFATYNGSSPFRTPATFNIIPYVEAHFGAWYVRGGLPKIATSLGELAANLGVKFRCQTTLVQWKENQALAQNGHTAKFDALICNGDVLTARTTFLAGTDVAPQELLRHDLSTSGFILFLGVKGRDPRLAHHNIFFSDDYPKEFADLHERKISPGEPTIYISISARNDPSHAPEGHDNYFVLVNTPARSKPWTDEEIRRFRDVIIQRLAHFGLDALPDRIVSETAFTSTDFAGRDLAYQGALYGWASHSLRTSLLRPAMKGPEGVYFVGGTTHPGGGIPLVLLSGKMVAEKILGEVRP